MGRIVFFLLGLIPLFTACTAPNCPPEPSLKEKSLHGRLIPKKVRPIRIMLDAGHGGQDKGTSSKDAPPILEKDLALTTTLMVKEYLRRMGYYPMLTRSSDTFVGLDTRVDIAHHQKSELFVSLHYNAAAATSAHGIEVFFYEKESDDEKRLKSQSLAGVVLEHVILESGAKSRGVKHGNFAVIRETKIPAILVEGGFMTNPDEMERLGQNQYLDRIAWGVAQGVDTYLKKAASL